MALLETHALTAFYGDFQALYGIDLELEAGETLAIIGANGAGKSTFLKTITGLLPARARQRRLRRPADRRAAARPRSCALGISLVPEGRRLFPSLTRRGEPADRRLRPARGRLLVARAHLRAVSRRCAERREAPSQTLSGGQQQMAAIGRALMSNPRVLLCDEISLGLAPIVIRDIYAALPRSRRTAPASSWSSRTSCRRCRSPTASIASRRAACR